MEQEEIFYKALLDRDSSFEGTFIVGVKTTGIFCRPTCTARKPKRENVEFFSSAKAAMAKGYRACKVCRPMEIAGKAPEFIRIVLDMLEEDPSRKLKDFDLRSRNIEPNKVRRWFQNNHGITFHAYQRMYRINQAFQKYKEGESVTHVAFDSGYESLSGFNESFKKTMGVSLQNSRVKRVINLIRLETPLGTMMACATEKGICLLEFTDRKMLETELKSLVRLYKAPVIQGDNPYFSLLKEEINAYFEGHLKDFTTPLDLEGTDFQKQVWNVLLQIPYGETTTYSQQAENIGNPAACRAVARANGMNRVSILVPCHRVIGSDGTLTGYGGGLWRKKKLLELEAQYT